MSLKSSQFTLFQVVFEVRYPPAYLHWDRAGHIWGAFGQEHDELRLQSAEPRESRFAIGDQVGLRVSIGNLAVSDFGAKGSLQRIRDLADGLVRLAVADLALREFSRIGCRFQMSRKCRDRRQAAELLSGVGLLAADRLGTSPINEAKLVEPSVEWRHENDELGFRVAMGAKQHRARVEVEPNPFGFVTQSVDKDVIVYDADFYTRRPMGAGQLDSGAWIADAWVKSSGYLKELIP